jgi:hypothetical protein
VFEKKPLSGSRYAFATLSRFAGEGKPSRVRGDTCDSCHRREGNLAAAWAAGTPGDILERLNREINTGLTDPAIKARLADVATTPMVMSVKAFSDYVAAEVEKWRKVIKLAGIKAS